jgi:AcrR family transcriptional regulator
LTPKPTGDAARRPLSRERVLAVAIDLADAGGIHALSMRALGRALGVEAMSLYHHVASKEELLAGMVDVIFGRIGLPEGPDWREAMRRRARAARVVFRRHRWAVGLLESRATPGAASLQHVEAVIAVLRGAGFSHALTAHAYVLLDSFIYGFAIQENAMPFEGPDEAGALAERTADTVPADAYPHILALTREVALQPGYDFADEFDFGLDLLLDGLERLRQAGNAAG